MNEQTIEGWLELTRDPDPKLRARAASKLCPCDVRRNHGEVWGGLLDPASSSGAAFGASSHPIDTRGKRRHRINWIATLTSL
jgi:hypothetical protein